MFLRQDLRYSARQTRCARASRRPLACEHTSAGRSDKVAQHHSSDQTMRRQSSAFEDSVPVPQIPKYNCHRDTKLSPTGQNGITSSHVWMIQARQHARTSFRCQKDTIQAWPGLEVQRKRHLALTRAGYRPGPKTDSMPEQLGNQPNRSSRGQTSEARRRADWCNKGIRKVVQTPDQCGQHSYGLLGRRFRCPPTTIIQKNATEAVLSLRNVAATIISLFLT